MPHKQLVIPIEVLRKMLRLSHASQAETLCAQPQVLSACKNKFTKLVSVLCPYRRGLLLLLWPISTLIIEFAAANPHFTEHIYSRGIYSVLAGIFGRLFGIFSFSVAEILFYVMLISMILYTVLQTIGLIKRRDRKQRILRILATAGCMMGISYFMFTMLSGLNYHRLTFAEQSGLDVRPSSAQELGLLYEELIERANYLRTLVNVDEDGVMVFYPYSIHDVARRAPEGIERLAEQYPVFDGFVPPPKPVLSSRGLSMLNIAGIYIPFTFEANVNADLPHYIIPFTMLHELSHFKGFMREDEANFIAYLAAREMDCPAFRYSGVMMALIYTGDALYNIDRELFFELNRQIDDAVWLDFAHSREFWAQFEGSETIAQIVVGVVAINHLYLLHNRQDDGVHSYGRMVDLLMADYHIRHGLIDSYITDS